VDSPGDGGAEASSASAYTLDNICEQTAPKTCQIRKSCCDKTSGYDETGCLAESNSTCARDVAEVRAGTMTFDPTNIEACYTKLGALTEKCVLTIDDLTTAAQVLKDCHVFVGKIGEGLPCERDNQCKPSATADAFVTCEKDHHTCKTIRLLSAGANCEFGDGIGAICAAGLYCDFPIGGNDPKPKGTCKTALAGGATCEKTQPFQCGLGRYCDDTKHCAPGKAGGATCDNALECASLTCEKTSDAGPGTCKKQEPLVKPNECGK
jgi:hypothetical protein